MAAKPDPKPDPNPDPEARSRLNQGVGNVTGINVPGMVSDTGCRVGTC